MKIVIIGAGSFGTSLAQILGKTNKVTLITRSKVLADSINHNHINNKYFPDIKLQKSIKADILYNCLLFVDIVILAIPSSAVLMEIEKIKPYIKKNVLLINTAKGFSTSNKTILESLQNFHKNSCSILGPTFAINLIKNQYSAFTVASSNIKHFKQVKKMFKKTNIILDYSVKYQLIEMASILKNVFAIANGVYSAIDDSINTKYAFLTQSYKEMNLVLSFLYGDISSDYYKNGVFGDLLLTSLSDQSRNKTLGQLIGRGFYTVDKNKNITLEGIKSTSKVYAIVRKHKLKTPIIKFVFNVLNGDNIYMQYDKCMKNIKSNNRRIKL
jgi:glycerol-3-phosphate dehydrogenase (NAD(P)+)